MTRAAALAQPLRSPYGSQGLLLCWLFYWLTLRSFASTYDGITAKSADFLLTDFISPIKLHLVLSYTLTTILVPKGIKIPGLGAHATNLVTKSIKIACVGVHATNLVTKGIKIPGLGVHATNLMPKGIKITGREFMRGI
ncbi:hypothetical protein [Paenibacillus apis]|uniref:hypothetical protein n=1 Tax=Paenibacillus apis TaxID=1792174 RepID=UPI0026586ADB|nr:hypothetical protein [Paenibacillus apis]